MNILLPRLSAQRSLQLYTSLQDRGLDALRRETGEEEKAGMNFRATGGEKISAEALHDLRTSIQEVAKGIDQAEGSARWNRELDLRLSRALGSDPVWTQRIPGGELFDLGFWSWMALVGAPEISTQRFKPSADGSKVRFIAHFRNGFYRCWLRGRALRDTSNPDDQWHLLGLREDQMVAIFERPGLSASWPLARAAARCALTWSGHSRGEQVTRHALKLLTAWNIPRCLELLDEPALGEVCNEAFSVASALD
jgi:hypothetical protein